MSGKKSSDKILPLVLSAWAVFFMDPEDPIRRMPRRYSPFVCPCGQILVKALRSTRQAFRCRARDSECEQGIDRRVNSDCFWNIVFQNCLPQSSSDTTSMILPIYKEKCNMPSFISCCNNTDQAFSFICAIGMKCLQVLFGMNRIPKRLLSWVGIIHGFVLQNTFQTVKKPVFFFFYNLLEEKMRITAKISYN